jgi:putative Mg2+ transporter-C (MgtC) family protein
MEATQALDPTTVSFWIRVAAAILCGGSLGLERQLRGKPAGIRTSILICLGTMCFVMLGASYAAPHVDPTRVLGQVVTGIGFLGAGVILTREGLVVGVTSAAVIWVLAALGAAIGMGFVLPAVTLAGVTLMVLLGVERLEATYRSLRRGVHGRFSLGGGNQEE